MDRRGIVEYLKTNLKPKRVEHSLGVEMEAARLAVRFGADPAKAALAGLAHDCAKGLDPVLMLRYAEEAGFPMDGMAGAGAGVLHAPAGAVLAQRAFGIDDREVLSAICWHAVPSLDMSVLDMAVSLADIIEPNRSFDGVERIRAAARKDLREAFRLSLARVMGHVLDDGLYLHPQTLQVYNGLTLEKLAAGG